MMNMRVIKWQARRGFYGDKVKVYITERLYPSHPGTTREKLVMLANDFHQWKDDHRKEVYHLINAYKFSRYLQDYPPTFKDEQATFVRERLLYEWLQDPYTANMTPAKIRDEYHELLYYELKDMCEQHGIQL